MTRAVGWLVLAVVALSALAAGAGISYDGPQGPGTHISVRGDEIALHGRGLYRHMSAEVAPQGIAQDYVTLLLGIPMLLGAAFSARRGSLRGRLLLAGTLGYFFVTWLFYLLMAMYSAMFLVYVALTGTSFFALALVLLGLRVDAPHTAFRRTTPARGAGAFLIANSLAIALLWLSVVVPPLLSGTVIPPQVEHYTTLVVQGLDLALLLPLGVVSGTLLMRRRPSGYLLGPVYLVFLSLLMVALCAKIVAMGLLGYAIVPAIFIIPTLTLLAVVLGLWMLRGIEDGRRTA